MSFARLMEIKRIIDERENDRDKEQYTLSAFNAFQMGAGNKMTFIEYLYHLGLSDEPPERTKVDDTEALSRMGIKVKKVKE